MVQTKMGRYWKQAKGWFFRKVWPFQTKEGRQTKVSQVCPTCESKRMSEGQRKSAVARKRAAANVGPKPTNVATFAKSKKADGGSVGNSMIKQAQRDYKGSYISGSLGGVKVSNPSYKKIL